MSNQQHPIIPPPKLAMHFRGVPLIPPLDCTDPQSWIAEQIYQMGATLAQPEPVVPTDETKEAMISALNTLEGWDNFDHWVWPVSALEQSKKNTTESLQMLRAVLARWGRPAIQPVPVAEPVAYLHRQGDYCDVSEIPLSEDEKDRGWTEIPLYSRHDLPIPNPTNHENHE